MDIQVRHPTFQDHLSGIIQKGYEIAQETGRVDFDTAADAYMFVEMQKISDEDLAQIKIQFNKRFK